MSDVGDLPSSEHAQAFLANPSPSGAVTLGADVIGRALLIYMGMNLFARNARSNVTRALAGAAAIEIFVVGFTLAQRKTP